jgi:hypothetical protein
MGRMRAWRLSPSVFFGIERALAGDVGPQYVRPVTEEELLVRLAGLRRATVGARRAPHKPLLLLWLFGRFATSGSSVTSYEEAEEPVSNLINEFGPAVANRSGARQRAAMPFRSPRTRALAAHGHVRAGDRARGAGTRRLAS